MMGDHMTRRTTIASVLGCSAWLSGACASDPEPAGDGSETGSTSTADSTIGATTQPATSSVDDDTAATTTTVGTTASTGDESSSGGVADESSSSTGEIDPGPDVDLSDPQLYAFEFTAADADEAATLALGTQLAQLDTRVAPIGRLVVYLHGAGTLDYCGAGSHGEMLAGLGFHVVMPCYVSDYGVDICDDDIGGCRLEAFEGVDHIGVIDITPPDAIETRVVRALQYLQAMNPGGDWQYFLDGETPRWDHIAISGISHGASSAGLIGKYREVDRVVSLSGPLDTDQAWLTDPSVTPIERFFGFTHTADGQHAGHLQSFEDLGLPGEPVVVDDTAPPYDGSHRLVTSAPTGDGHGSTQAGGSSPQDGDAWVFAPVWQYMYTEPL
jgi:hypothetical protein